MGYYRRLKFTNTTDQGRQYDPRALRQPTETTNRLDGQQDGICRLFLFYALRLYMSAWEDGV
jgi:hypothetical protein